jgi:hypothetical protein
MLRKLIVTIGACCMLAGVTMVLKGAYPPGILFIVWGGIMVFGIIYEHYQYKPVVTKGPGAGWVRTNERFVDDKTGKPVTVYVQPVTGERQYVAE